MISLVYNTLGMVAAEEPVVLQRPRILGANGLHALIGDALECLELAVVNLEPGSNLVLTHRFARRTHVSGT